MEEQYWNRCSENISFDTKGRYAYGNQPSIELWNLARLGDALVPIIGIDEQRSERELIQVLERYRPRFEQYYHAGLRAKLGLSEEKQGDQVLIEQLLNLMKEYRADYTNTFVDLTHMSIPESADDPINPWIGKKELYQSEGFGSWQKQWKKRLQQEQRSATTIYQSMKSVNPSVIPRNYHVEKVLRSVEEGDIQSLLEFLIVLRHPYAYERRQQPYQQVPQSPDKYMTFCGT